MLHYILSNILISNKYAISNLRVFLKGLMKFIKFQDFTCNYMEIKIYLTNLTNESWNIHIRE